MEPNDPQSASGGGEKKHEFAIFIDAKKYVVDKTSMTGAEIKAIAHIDAQYQLYLEEQGDRPDKPIKDTEAVAIRNDMHFYAIPPATMGRRVCKP
jgi:Multiubiquitin